MRVEFPVLRTSHCIRLVPYLGANLDEALRAIACLLAFLAGRKGGVNVTLTAKRPTSHQVLLGEGASQLLSACYGAKPSLDKNGPAHFEESSKLRSDVL